jgi:hypothetical protein
MSRIVIVLLIMSFSVNTAAALDGSGTQEDPWRIESLVDFNEFAADANYWDDYTRLETDVNLAGRVYSRAVIAWDVNSEESFQGTAFTGVFDGNDHKIMNLTIDDGGAGNDYLGLFGSVDNSEVRNLGIESSFVTGTGVFIGGLLGNANNSSLSNCYSTGSVSGDDTIGGLLGRNWGGNVSNCYSAVDVSGVDQPAGLVGTNTGSVSNCYSTGDVTGTGINVGGLVGISLFGSVSNCYSTGDVNGTGVKVGGLVGVNGQLSSVSHCFWNTDTQTHGVTDSIGSNSGTVTNVAGLPTAEMQIKITFTDAGWDFVEIWLINEGATYPVLRQEIRSDLNGDGGVDFADFAIFADHWLEGKGN